MSYRIERMHYDTVAVQMESGVTGESSAWSVLIAHSPEAELRGWVIPAKNVPSGSGKPDAWMSHPDAKMFTLKDLFYSSRSDLSDFFLNLMAKDTDSRFMGWMEQNEHNLNVLTRLNYPVPAYCSSPVGYVLQNRWDAQIHKLEHLHWGSEESAEAELGTIDSLSNLYTVPVDKKRTSHTLQTVIIKALEMLQQRPAAKVCDRLFGLMDIVDKFSIPVSKSKLEDFFYPVHEGVLNDLYEKYKGGSCNEEEKELLKQLVGLASRMNFNTDRYAM
ncbi:hypothetical protein R80B4_02281 [Fibrobacteres bacterium R8-0-B4]